MSGVARGVGPIVRMTANRSNPPRLDSPEIAHLHTVHDRHHACAFDELRVGDAKVNPSDHPAHRTSPRATIARIMAASVGENLGRLLMRPRSQSARMMPEGAWLCSGRMI